MKLTSVIVKKYKSFLTEQTVAIEDGVTRLVGKNESGKTAFLEALAKYNYFDEKDKKFTFDRTHDYPRNELKAYEQQNPENNLAVVTCIFDLDDKLIDEIKEDVGKNTFTQKTIKISRNYSGNLTYHDLNTNTQKFIEYFLAKYTISADKMDELIKAKTVNELYELLIKDNELQAIAKTLKTDYIEKASTDFNDNIVGGYIAKQHLSPNIPQFWYFDEYYALPAQTSLTKYIQKSFDANFTKEHYDIATALFTLAGVDVLKLQTDKNHEAYIAELEATSNSITDNFLKYWSTNKNLEIVFDIQSVGNDKLLNIRIRNTKHRVTLPLINRSKGFIWFFSFLVWFSRIEDKKNIIILMDEPGLNLHAEAQSDLLNYIDKELVPKYQIVYTTHSPFMIDPGKLHEVRTVYDSNDSKVGSLISDAIEEKDKATLFPLQAALGYDIAQNLYISPKNLLVEGVADLVYLTMISDKLRTIEKPSLDESITIVPVGGLDKVATFISLLRGNRLQIACLLDTFTDQKGKTRISDLIRDKIIKENNVIFFDEFTLGINPSEVEDMFTVDEYLALFNSEFAELSNINGNTIDKTTSIVKQINKAIGKERYNHYRPANYLSRHPDLIDKLSEETLNRFACAFDRINRALN